MVNFASVFLGSGKYLTALLSVVPLFFDPRPAIPPEMGPADATGSVETSADSTTASDPGDQGLFMAFEFTFPDSTGIVELRLEGDFVEVDETWRATSKNQFRWGTSNARLVFDNREKTLIIINETNNTYTELTEPTVERIRSDLSERRPMEQHSLMNRAPPAPPDSEEEIADDTPSYIALPEKAHPAECRAYERSLPRGLHEETCFTSWKRAGVRPVRLDALKSLRQFIRGLDKPLSELEVISAISDALAWDLGLAVSQYKFGKSPLAPGDSDPGLDPWDRVFKLKVVRPHSLKPSDINLPKSATQEFGIVPWPTPMIYL